MDKARIDKEMQELEGILAYTFHDIAQLSHAMHSVLLEKREGDGKSNQEYANDALACLGDTVIKYLIARYLFDQGKRKGEITAEKIKLEGNEVLHKITTEYHIIDYAYNNKHFVKDDPPQHEKVRSESHDPYIEAITAAILLDGGWEKVDRWFQTWLLPKLERHKLS